MIHDDFFHHHNVRNNDVPVFYLNDILENAKDPTFDETAQEFLKAGLLKPPYHNFYVFIKMDGAYFIYHMDNGKVQEYLVSQRGKFLDPRQDRNVEFKGNYFWCPNDHSQQISSLMAVVLLIIFMKSMRREKVEISQRLNDSRSKKGKYEYSGYTIIRNPPAANEEKGEHCPTGLKRKPHWRRGHVRRYKSGRVTYIEPVLVNMHLGELTQKKVYKVAA
ncbi:hypothetical protein [Dyadobacter jiangsuensis]|uniref:Uncharacterized protein n=1 Tax=Dyadobacter jiangsuensis TaxID=1591085 RepID=A0A2P8FP11_9BACT|nr:hypothetical protein [Dyadobacter jiangsuensis]PSL23458.1 hypothetical protein CLV60_11613 [Dyadobacter jiangsuensis]